MRLLLLNPNTTAAVTEACAAAARAAAGPGTTIVTATGAFGPAIINSRAENAIAAHGVLTAAARHAADVDAILLAVSYDTALMAVRELLDIPVVGMTEAGMVAACLLGARFGLVVFGTPELYREHVAALGFGPRFAGLRSVDMSAASAFSDREAVLARVTDAAQALAREDGAEAVVLCGAAMAGMATTLQRAVDVPLVDGIAAGVPLAEMLVRLKPVAPRTGSLARPRARASAGLDPALAALLARS